jgi:Na+/melibiose symporter-like transporter
MMLGGGIFLCLFLKEIKPAEEPPTFKGGFLGVYKAIFADKMLFPVYLIMFCMIMVQQGLDSLAPLLFTEQWGYTKQDMGTNFLAGGLINLFYIPILGWVVDKFDRMKLFLWALVGTMVVKIGYYIFIQFILPDSRPEIIHMIIFGQMGSMLGWIIQVAFWPLIYDFIPRDRMGTAQTGLMVVKTITRLILMNGIGLWVTLYSMMFLPEGTFDYFSAYIFLIITDVIGVAIIANFMYKVKVGRLKPVGRDEFKPVDEDGATGSAKA